MIDQDTLEASAWRNSSTNSASSAKWVFITLSGAAAGRVQPSRPVGADMSWRPCAARVGGVKLGVAGEISIVLVSVGWELTFAITRAVESA
jgi:hypothetical protein